MHPVHTRWIMTNHTTHTTISVTVDVVLFCMYNTTLHILLIERKYSPYAGAWAIPGGFVDADESLAQAARRELFEKPVSAMSTSSNSIPLAILGVTRAAKASAWPISACVAPHPNSPRPTKRPKCNGTPLPNSLPYWHLTTTKSSPWRGRACKPN